VKVMKIEIESTEGGATLRRAEGLVKVQWVTAAHGAQERQVGARDLVRQAALAGRLQRELDGYRGTAGDVEAYDRVIEMLAD